MATTGIDLMRHALGVHSYIIRGERRYSKPFRNHFCAGEGDRPMWDALVANGFATKRLGNEITGGCPTYYVTDAGRRAALAGITFKTRWGYATAVPS